MLPEGSKLRLEVSLALSRCHSCQAHCERLVHPQQMQRATQVTSALLPGLHGHLGSRACRLCSSTASDRMSSWAHSCMIIFGGKDAVACFAMLKASYSRFVRSWAFEKDRECFHCFYECEDMHPFKQTPVETCLFPLAVKQVAVRQLLWCIRCSKESRDCLFLCIW